MENNNKRKITGCVGGVILLLLVTALVACSKDNGDVEVAIITEETEEIETEESEAEETETEESEAEETETEESEAEETEAEESEAEETEAEESEAEETEAEETEAEESEAEETETENTEPTANKTETSTSWGTPQEYNGDPEGKGPGRIIVKGFDYNDFFDGLSWKGEYWTASNGVEIKVLSIIDGKGEGMVPVPDGKGKDNEPNSPFQAAMAEAAGVAGDYSDDIEVTIPLATYKRTDINTNDSNLVAYKNAYDYKLYAVNFMTEYYKPYKQGDPVNLSLAVAYDGVAEFDELGAKFWHIRKVNDYWEVKIYGNLAEFRWDGIHQILRYLSPDGDSLYDVIYEDWYFGSPVILEYEDWFAVGNSQIYQKDTENMGYGIYYFK